MADIGNISSYRERNRLVFQRLQISEIGIRGIGEIGFPGQFCGKIQFFLGPGLLGELPHDAVHHLGEDLVVEPVVTAAQELDLHLSLGHHRRAFGDFHQTVIAIHHRIPGEGADIIPHAGFIRDDVGAVPPSKMV